MSRPSWPTSLVPTLALLGLLLGGCQSSNIIEEAPPTNTGMLVLEDYIVGVGDGLQVSVWRNPELSISVTVRPDGRISVPLIGDVEASGFTPEHLAENIGENLREYIKDPQVSVIVVAMNNLTFINRVRITGAVGAQLSIPWQPGVTVLDLVLQAGGPTDFAVQDETILYRDNKAYRIRLRDILERGRLDTNYELLPGDVITIAERAF